MYPCVKGTACANLVDANQIMNPKRSKKLQSRWPVNSVKLRECSHAEVESFPMQNERFACYSVLIVELNVDVFESAICAEMNEIRLLMIGVSRPSV